MDEIPPLFLISVRNPATFQDMIFKLGSASVDNVFRGKSSRGNKGRSKCGFLVPVAPASASSVGASALIGVVDLVGDVSLEFRFIADKVAQRIKEKELGREN